MFRKPKQLQPPDVARLMLVMSNRTLDDKFLEALSRGLDRDVGGDSKSAIELILYGLAPFNFALAETRTTKLVEILEALESESLTLANSTLTQFGHQPYSADGWRTLFRSRLGEYFTAATAPVSQGMPAAKHPLTEIGRIAASHLAPGIAAFPDVKALIGTHFARASQYARDVLADNGMRPGPG